MSGAARRIAGFPLSVRARLIAGFAGVFLPLGALGLLALLTLGAANAHTHELYQQRLVAIVTLGQTVNNLDQMRQMVVQDVLAAGTPSLLRAQHQAIAVQLATLDAAIARTMARYALTPMPPRQHGVLRRWPGAWRGFLAARGALLRQNAGGRAHRRPAPPALTVTLNDRLNTVLDLVYALMGAEQREGQLLDQTQQDTYRQTAAVLVSGLVLIALFSVGLAVSLTRSVARLYDDADARARHDALTGLPNRALLHERLARAVRAAGHADAGGAQGTPASTALLLLDLDRFKEVNDTLGHHVGDALLRQVGPRLRAALRATDTVARLGGDEFAVVLRDADAAGAVVVAGALNAALAAPFIVEGQALAVGVSIGVALCPQHGTDAATLLQHADVAMYVAKRGQLDHAVYDPSLDGHDTADLTLVAELRQALAADGLVLHYQPKIHVPTGQICGVEALVRWPHPTQGLIPPDRFIGLAEQTGLIVPLTRWVLEAALRQSRTWRDAGLDLEMAVNLSLRNLRDPQLRATVAELLARYAVPPGRVCLELTESVVMADVEGTQASLAQLAALGVRLAIDDFGTGYSSLSYLSRLPVNELKIDRSFVQHAAHTATDATIVASTIGLGHSLGMSIVTEGVEDAETWALLGRLGSDVAQGYFFSRPLPAPELEGWIGRVSADARRASA